MEPTNEKPSFDMQILKEKITSTCRSYPWLTVGAALGLGVLLAKTTFAGRLLRMGGKTLGLVTLGSKASALSDISGAALKAAIVAAGARALSDSDEDKQSASPAKTFPEEHVGQKANLRNPLHN